MWRSCFWPNKLWDVRTGTALGAPPEALAVVFAVFGRHKGSMLEVRYSEGVELPSVGLWLDPRRRKPLAFVSHAHSDHIAGHEEVFLTPATALLMRARLSGKRIEHQLPYFQSLERADSRMTLLPAGHICGSAQIFLESEAGSLLYTGDFKLRGSRSTMPCDWRTADTLIMESTFGLPKYRLPPTQEVEESILAFCRQTLESGAVPVLYCYSLGKSQEVAWMLLENGLIPMLAPAAYRMTQICASVQAGFPSGFLPLDTDEAGGKVVICPPGRVSRQRLRALRSQKTAMLTGWAMIPGARFRYGCDAAFPMSDHADYPDLLRYVELVQPKRVLTLHGSAAAFAADLRARGHDAWALSQENQLELALQ